MGPIRRSITHILILLAAILLLAASVHAQDSGDSAPVEAATAAAAATPDDVPAPQTFGHITCQRYLPGCRRCRMYFIKTRKAPANNSSRAAVKPDASDPSHFRLVKRYVCLQCFPGYDLVGTGKLTDPKPKYCTPKGTSPSPSPGQLCAPVPPPVPNSVPFPTNCSRTLGSTCNTTCTRGATGPGYNATCSLYNGNITWLVDGGCSTPFCPPLPPANSAPNSVGFSECPGTVGSTCVALCQPGFDGPGYTASCGFVGEDFNPSWTVTGSCVAGPRCPTSPGQVPNSPGFSEPLSTNGNCFTTPGATCKAQCGPNAFGPGYTAFCVLNPDNGVADWEIAGYCSTGPAACPPTPVAGSAPFSLGFQNCPTQLGSTCTAQCAGGTVGTGYTARCLLNQGVPGWVVTGSCSLPGFVVSSCQSNCGGRGLVDQTTRRRCYCDYWCDLYGDCCGGLNGQAAANKNAVCPDMAPTTTSLATVTTCSNQRGLLFGVTKCASYRPGGCWCDSFCVNAGDCCDNCPASCPGAVCPARPTGAAAASAVRGAGSNLPNGKCAADETRKLDTAWREQQAEAQAASSGGVKPAAFSQDFEARCQLCQDTLIQTDLSTPVIEIPTWVVNTRLGNLQGTYTANRATQLMDLVNRAFARTGFRFTLQQFVDGISFSNQNTLDYQDCRTNPPNPNCERCRNYRQIVPTNSQGSRVLVIYMTPYPTNPATSFVVGSATFPQSYYNPYPVSNAQPISCVDGVYGVAYPTNQGGLAQALLRDSANIVHEIGHWMGLGHTWNQNGNTGVSLNDLCQQSSGSNAVNYQFIEFGLSDGVRDTPPQLPLVGRGPTNNTVYNPIFFGCNADGSFNTTDPTQGPPFSCNGGAPTQGLYFNNFYNYMSYYDNTCAARTRARTFSAGQVARMRCVFRCYRANECGDGAFFPN